MPGQRRNRPTRGGLRDGRGRASCPAADAPPDPAAVCREVFDSIGFYYGLLRVVPDPQGTEAAGLVVADVNEEVVTLLGTSRDSIVGRPYLDFRPYAFQEGYERLTSVAASGSIQTFEIEPSGTGRTLRVRLFRPSPGFVAAIGWDVTAELARFRELEERLVELRETQRVAKVGTWARDLATSISTWSEETYRIHGLDPSGPVPTLDQLPRFYSSEDIENLVPAFERAVKDGTPYEVVLHVTRPDGGMATAIARGEGIRGPDGTIVRLRGTMTDFSEQAATRGEVDALRDQLSHVSRVSVLGEMVSALAHDLSQPLAAILANAQAAARTLRIGEAPKEGFTDLLGDIVAEAGRAAAVIGQLRAHLRRESPVPAPVDVNGLVEEAVHLVSAEARAQEVEIVRRLAPLLPRILGDRVQLEQVVVNVVLNAIDAMKDGPVHRTVTIRTLREGDRVLLEIADSGPGIPEELLEKVFEPFYSTKNGGLGIGLPSCRTIVRSHGGTIRAERRPGRGATIIVSLPAARAHGGAGEVP